jgi:hypothetical protein
MASSRLEVVFEVVFGVVFKFGCRGLVGKSLRKFLTALELPKKIIEETLTDCAITALKMLPKDLPQPFIIKFRTIMLIKGHGPDFKLECRQATVV